MSGAARFITGILLEGLVILLAALPVMWLTAFLHAHGFPLAPLGYLDSLLVAFLVGWIIESGGSARRMMAEMD